jgi:hypothetical protein
MTAPLPFLTAFDPPGTSEGTLDPLGLYTIADQLGVSLVPGVRERMQRIRFLTVMVVGAAVTEDIDADPTVAASTPSRAWEWLVVEALMRRFDGDEGMRGVPGSDVVRRSIARSDYVDARGYLKSPHIFGFHGVYKRLAMQVGLLDVQLRPGPTSAPLLDAWAQGLRDRVAPGPLLKRWANAVRRGLAERPPRTKPGWTGGEWQELAEAVAPSGAKARERRCVRELLLATEKRRLGALPEIWRLQEENRGLELDERALHELLREREPGMSPLLAAIGAYEAFARRLQDAFDVLRAAAASGESYVVEDIARDADFVRCVERLDERFASAHRALGELALADAPLHARFTDRFQRFAGPMGPAECARALCDHHKEVQRFKSAEGKRPWFDALGEGRIYLRHAYRVARPDVRLDRYLHDYRATPIRQFREDLP